MRNIGDVIKSFSNLVNHANSESGPKDIDLFVEVYLKYRSSMSGKDILCEVQMAEICLKLLKDKLFNKQLEIITSKPEEKKRVIFDEPKGKGMKISQFIKIFQLKPNLRVTMRKDILNEILVGYKDKKTTDFFIQYIDGVRWLNSKPYLAPYSLEELKRRIEENNRIYLLYPE